MGRALAKSFTNCEVRFSKKTDFLLGIQDFRVLLVYKPYVTFYDFSGYKNAILITRTNN